MNKIAIIILNWNGSNMLQSYLPSTIRNSQGKDIQIYIADNGSSDDSIEIIKQKFKEIKLILLDKNYGFAEGYNKAINQINAEYIVLLNSDIEVTPHWLEALTLYMDSHPEVAACQPKILSLRNKKKFEYAGAAGGYIDYLGYPFCRGRIFSNVENDTGQYDNPFPIFWASGAALFIRLTDYIGVGGLDGTFFAHMEEIDLCWRLRARGRLIYCIPQSTVYHLGGGTLKKESPYKTKLNFRNNLILLYKNLPQKEGNKILYIRRILDNIAALSFLLKGHLSNALAVYKARYEFAQIKHKYDSAQQENIRQQKVQIPERIHKSILIEYFIFRHHTFNKIVKQKD